MNTSRTLRVKNKDGSFYDVKIETKNSNMDNQKFMSWGSRKRLPRTLLQINRSGKSEKEIKRTEKPDNFDYLRWLE